MDASYLGLIEGFYGRTYTESEHNFLFKFLKEHNYRFFIYAPKEDVQLRDQWEQPISPVYAARLKSLSQRCHAQDLDFGLALSPLNLTAHFEEQKDILLTRLNELCDIAHPEIVSILFDDMDKTSEDVGSVQNHIIKLVEQHLPHYVKHFIVCPSYYTDDPILDRLFGQRPQNYFTELTADLSERVEIFWTGPKVLSEDITAEHAAYVTKFLGRKPFIWDNYPVNDGQAIHNFLFLNKFKGRRHLSDKITGHAINPMVQCYLSCLPSLSLPLLYQDKSDQEIDQAMQDFAVQLFGKAAAELMLPENLEILTTVGTAKMSDEQQQHLLNICEKDQTPALEELKDFLSRHSQRFDQAIVNRQHHTTIKED